MKVNLDKSYAWKGTTYQQGEADIPEDLAQALNLSEVGAAPDPKPPSQPSKRLLELG